VFSVNVNEPDRVLVNGEIDSNYGSFLAHHNSGLVSLISSALGEAVADEEATASRELRGSKQRRHPDLGFIAVGMVIADHPPHRSEHALLTHSAPTSSM